MIRNYFAIALRHMLRDTRTTAINIVGLTIGIAAFFLIMLWVNYQVNYDSFHKNLSSIYTIMADRSQDTRVSIEPNTPYALAEVIRDQSGIQRIARLISQQDILLVSEDHKQEEFLHFTDPEFLEIFSFETLASVTPTPLTDPNSVVLTKSAYARYFGDQPLTGQVLHMKSWGFEKDLKVTAILDDPPANSSIQFTFLLPIKLLADNHEWMTSWGTASLITYVQINEDSNPSDVTAQIRNVPGQHHSWVYELFLFPFSKNHLYNVFNDRQGTGRIIYIYIFTGAAFLILVLACINFTNLATAQAGRRAREIGVRKTMGAQSGNIRIQVMLEGVIVALVSAVFALTLIQLILPYYNDLLNTQFEAGWISLKYIMLITGTALVTGLLAAIYPAVVYARFNPSRVLKSSYASGTKLHWSKQALLVFQLVISVVMISAAIVVFRQVNYLNDTPLGFEKNNLMYFYIHENGAYEHHADFANRLRQSPDIEEVTFLNQNPLQVYQTSGDPDWEGKNPEISYAPFSFIDADYDVEKVLHLEITEGRSFDRTIASDTASFIVNERAAAMMGGDVIGKSMEFWDKKGSIIGVFRDFHHLSLHNEIRPMIIRYWRGNTNMVFLRVEDHLPETIEYIKSVYSTYEAEYPFSYNFVDEEFERMYTAEKQIRSLAVLFAVMSVLIAALGLYGLVSYVLQGQVKTIGIRKVMGATTRQVTGMFLFRFSLWIIYALLVALPVSYFLLRSWLTNFAYRVGVGPADFITGAAIIMLITFLTIFSRVVRAASTNPAETLKNE